MTFTVNITIPDTIYHTLIATAHTRGQSVEAVAADWLRLAAQQIAPDPIEAFIGAFDSASSDWADDHDRYLGATHGEHVDQEQ